MEQRGGALGGGAAATIIGEAVGTAIFVAVTAIIVLEFLDVDSDFKYWLKSVFRWD